MAYQYENVKLEKGMYGQNGRSFLKVLESLDPSENYKGTALEGLDAFQRQLKRFDIHVKGAGSDMVEKFFHTSESSVLFPEFVSRVVRQGMESDILPDITATVTNFDGMDYRSIASVPTDDDKELKRVEEVLRRGLRLGAVGLRHPVPFRGLPEEGEEALKPFTCPDVHPRPPSAAPGRGLP